MWSVNYGQRRRVEHRGEKIQHLVRRRQKEVNAQFPLLVMSYLIDCLWWDPPPPPHSRRETSQCDLSLFLPSSPPLPRWALRQRGRWHKPLERAAARAARVHIDFQLAPGNTGDFTSRFHHTLFAQCRPLFFPPISPKIKHLNLKKITYLAVCLWPLAEIRFDGASTCWTGKRIKITI